MTHHGMGYSDQEDQMLGAEEAVEIRVLRRQGKSIREIARMLARRATPCGGICAAKDCRAMSVSREGANLIDTKITLPEE
jgi:hypothetical protein